MAFYLGLGALFTHEIDAIPNHEWRGMPLLGTLPDETGMLVFIAAHVPLFAVLIALVASKDERIRRFSRLGISAFLVVHALLHALSAGEPTYEFSSSLSRLLIFGGGVLGALYLVLSLKRERVASAIIIFALRSAVGGGPAAERPSVRRAVSRMNRNLPGGVTVTEGIP